MYIFTRINLFIYLEYWILIYWPLLRNAKEAMASNPLRPKVIELYKTLLYLGKEYPMGADYFRTKLKGAFMKNKDVSDPKEIEMLIERGNYVVKELEALYMLRKYRTLKKRYYDKKEPS
ncbi:electron transfer flavoprotein regulatory factor 1-like isoform X2 [Mercenaria mercenaria]|uniref:electron transfer flavoprotein regulatory factor 1-like isoform X2 n=1 Tax=Mercenaria mercenaria TaxID=6596 RepID=UPI00234EADFA|nr:electron transfer flavoprotein regulatory factor 1-like isoform X2 [Mercenaria mercenaria]